MSMGYGGGCIKYGEDANTVIYEFIMSASPASANLGCRSS